jgi:hypothetical protein
MKPFGASKRKPRVQVVLPFETKRTDPGVELLRWKFLLELAQTGGPETTHRRSWSATSEVASRNGPLAMTNSLKSEAWLNAPTWQATDSVPERMPAAPSASQLPLLVRSPQDAILTRRDEVIHSSKKIWP